MKLVLICSILVFKLIDCRAQSIKDLSNMSPDKQFDNIEVKTLSSDSLATSFIIWIKTSVKLHKHITHSEQVYILEGYGKMQLGDSTFDISSGNFIQIPKNIVHGVEVLSEKPMKVLSIQAPKFEGKDRYFLE